jgi:hypothetical protein
MFGCLTVEFPLLHEISFTLVQFGGFPGLAFRQRNAFTPCQEVQSLARQKGAKIGLIELSRLQNWSKLIGSRKSVVVFEKQVGSLPFVFSDALGEPKNKQK